MAKEWVQVNQNEGEADDWILSPDLPDVDKVAPRGRAGLKKTVQRRIAEAKRFNTELSPAERQDAKNISELGLFDRSMLAGGRVTEDLRRGGKQAAVRSFLNMIADLPGTDSSSPLDHVFKYIDDTIDLNKSISKMFDKENEPIRRKDEPLVEGAGVLANVLGGSLPFALSGGFTKKVGSLGIDAITAPFTAYGKAKRAGYMGKGAMDEVTKKPLRTVDWDAATRNKAENLVGGAIVGAGEGYIDPNSTIGEGIASSVIGTAPGIVPETFRLGIPRTDFNIKASDLQRTPYAPSAADQPHIDWYKKNVGHPSAGTESGSYPAQYEEHTLRNDPVYVPDIERTVDAPNRRAEMSLVKEAMGMGDRYKMDQKGFLSEKDINDHFANMGEEMDMLQEGTTGIIKPKDLQKVLDDTKELVSDEGGLKNKATINAILDQMSGTKPLVRRDMITGKFLPASFSGAKYQELTSSISEAKGQMYQSGNRKAAKVLEYLQETIDKAVAKGVEAKRGTKNAADWGDVRERYGITKMVLDKAVNPGTGELDVGALTRHLSANDSDRMLRGTGKGRIEPLHRLAKYHEVLRKQPNPGLAGSNIVDTGSGKGMLERDKLNVTPGDLESSWLRGLRVRRRFGHYPTVKGYLGGLDVKLGRGKDAIDLGVLGLDPRNDLLNINRMTRAVGQAGDIAPKTLDAANEAIDWVSGKKDDEVKRLEDLLEELKSKGY